MSTTTTTTQIINDNTIRIQLKILTIIRLRLRLQLKILTIIKNTTQNINNDTTTPAPTTTI